MRRAAGLILDTERTRTPPARRIARVLKARMEEMKRRCVDVTEAEQHVDCLWRKADIRETAF